METRKSRGRGRDADVTPVASDESTPVPGLAAEMERSVSAEEKRAMIRMAAYKCFSESGYYETTVDDICERLGISKGAFYWYYNGKQAVFTSILDDWADTVERQLEAQFRDAVLGPQPFEALTTALAREVRRGRHIMYIWLEFLAQAGRFPYIREGLASFHARIRGTIVRVLAPMFPPDLGAPERDAMATVILAAFMGLVTQELIDPNTASATDSIRIFMNNLQSKLEQNTGITPGQAALLS